MANAPVCAYCRQRPIDPRLRPFCSSRCRMADLGRWLRGDYRIPGSDASDTPESPTTDGPPGSADEYHG